MSNDYMPIKYVQRKTKEIITEKIPGESYLKFLYYSPFGKLTLEALVKRKFLSTIYGAIMSGKNSIKKILPFVQNYNINMDQCVKKIDQFTSFNDFFARKLSQDARPIDNDPRSLISPADGKILAFENIDLLSTYFVKGNSFTLEKFFANKELARSFDKGTFIIVRLAPVDYHRFHFPASGTISKSILIDGSYYSVSTVAIREKFDIFLENKREMSILESDDFGKIALFEIGATMVGGITQTYTPGKISKGDEKGYFYFGGSTCIMIFQKNTVIIDQDILDNTNNKLETKIQMGERIGISTK